MSRKIKFRAWNKEKKEMLYDIGLVKLKNNYHPCWFDMENGSYEIRARNDYVIMQYVGLKDKNGVEIYEGDIVTFCIDNENSLYEIIFDEEYASFEAKCIKSNDKGIVGKTSCIFVGRIREVIGNIYENPELLNKDAK